MTRRIIQVCEVIMELGWLLTLVSIPIYFNIYTSRVFEPDKITLFRSLVLVMLLAWAAKGLALLTLDRDGLAPIRKGGRNQETQEIIYPPDGEVIGPDTRPFPENVLRRPLILFAFFLSFCYIISTIFSIVPGVSWWGSYQRLQGTYTFLSYVGFFAVIVFNMRERRQIERLISFVLLANIPISLYGLLQHNKADPLPWQGDVVLRVTSTMGNAIFISAYLMLVVPLLVYRMVNTANWLIANRSQADKYFKGRNRDTALSWAALYGCFILFLTGVFFVVLNFNANYRPEAVQTPQLAASDGVRLASDAAGAGSVSLTGAESVGPWWALPVGIMVSFGLFFLFTVRRRGTDTNYLFRIFEVVSYAALLTVVILTIFYSQSRGPLAGMIFGLFVFFPILMWRRHAWTWLVSWFGISIVGGVLLVLFNLPVGSTPLEPVFSIARKNDQIARLGQFLQTNDGTGLVRQLIWKTVLEVMGEAAEKEQVRLIIGYGPESLYNKSPQHYQAELAQIEARNAIPDRSHNGYLDALATTGVLGLIAYLALVGAFIYYAFKFLRRTERFENQALITALISLVLGHQVEIQTGIQIASTWMMFWTCAALLVVMGGLIYGRWDLVGVKAAIAEPILETPTMLESLPPPVVDEVEPVGVGKNSKKNGGSSKNKTGSKPKVTREPAYVPRILKEPVVSNRPNRKTGPIYANAFTEPNYGWAGERAVKPWYWAAIAGIALMAILYGWFGNIVPIVADTIYKQGFNLTQGQAQWGRAAPYLQQATTYAPNEDYYALYLGQAYLEIAQSQISAAGTDATKLALVKRYMEASERELLRANKLAPLNPDHYANMARLYTRWADIEPTKAKDFLIKAVDWYKRGVTNYAPRNARLWAELAFTQATLATNRLDPTVSGTPVDQAIMADAIASGEKSISVDPKYDFSRSVFGDILRYAGKPSEAGIQYLELANLDYAYLTNDGRFLLKMQAIGQSTLVSVERMLEVFNPERFGKPGDATPQVTINNNKGLAYMGRGAYYFYKNNLEEAKAALINATGLNLTDPYAHAYLSSVYKKQGQQNLAQTEAAQARQLATSSPQNQQQTSQAVESILAS